MGVRIACRYLHGDLMAALPPFELILGRLPALRKHIAADRHTLLAELAMVSEIPAPTFGEQQRADFLQERFGQFGLTDVVQDELGNVAAIHPGTESDGGAILLVAHLDTLFTDGTEHLTEVRPDRVVGASVADDSLGLAVLTTLPHLLERLRLTLRRDVLLLGTTRSLGRGNLAGLRHFLENTRIPIRHALCVEGAPLGRLSHSSIGMVRGNVVCRIPEQYDWTRFGEASAIVTLNEMINRVLALPMPRRPRSTVVLGEVRGGTAAHTVATRATLGFEARSESGRVVADLLHAIGRITQQVAAQSGEHVELELVARRHPGGIGLDHPLVDRSHRIMSRLGLSPRMTPSTSELAALIDRRTPAITIGITENAHPGEADETVFIEPMATGVTQLLGILLAIDGGYCDE